MGVFERANGLWHEACTIRVQRRTPKEDSPRQGRQVKFDSGSVGRSPGKTNLERKNVMKRISTSILLTLVSLVAVGNSFAQDHGVKATVPFQFTVGTKLLPSGNYTITSDINSPSVVVIRNTEQQIAVLSTAYGDGKNSKKNVLVFNKYGDQYFLHEILCSSSD